MKFVRESGYKFKYNRKVKYGIFKCDCGVEIEVSISNGRKQKHCKKCGNKSISKKNREIRTTHGGRYTKLYGVWNGMKDRCYNANSTDAKNYMDRGVTVCGEWKNDFVAFRDWCMNNGYKDGLHIDKDILSAELGINPPIYSPDTCMFVKPKENNRAKRGIVMNADIAQEIRNSYKKIGFSMTVNKFKNHCSRSIVSNIIYGGQWK